MDGRAHDLLAEDPGEGDLAIRAELHGFNGQRDMALGHHAAGDHRRHDAAAGLLHDDVFDMAAVVAIGGAQDPLILADAKDTQFIGVSRRRARSAAARENRTVGFMGIE